MRVFISHSHRDAAIVERIAHRLKSDGHEIWEQSYSVKPGDNIQRAIRAELEQADAVIVVISENSFRSKWVQYEFTTIALQQISRREQRIIPIKVDRSDVPSYLADRAYIDFSQDFDA